MKKLIISTFAFALILLCFSSSLFAKPYAHFDFEHVAHEWLSSASTGYLTKEGTGCATLNTRGDNMTTYGPSLVTSNNSNYTTFNSELVCYEYGRVGHRWNVPGYSRVNICYYDASFAKGGPIKMGLSTRAQNVVMHIRGTWSPDS